MGVGTGVRKPDGQILRPLVGGLEACDDDLLGSDEAGGRCRDVGIRGAKCDGLHVGAGNLVGTKGFDDFLGGAVVDDEGQRGPGRR